MHYGEVICVYMCLHASSSIESCMGRIHQKLLDAFHHSIYNILNQKEFQKLGVAQIHVLRPP
jgi:hypothetical protein